MSEDETFGRKPTARWICCTIVVLVVALTVCGFLAARHFVIHDGGIAITSKLSLSLRDTFVDVRDWRFEDFQEHPGLRASLETAGLNEPVRSALVRGMTPELRQAVEPLEFPVNSCWLRSHYVLLTAKGVAIIPRKYIADDCSETDAFVDIRTWTRDDFKDEADLKASLIVAGHRDLLIEMKVAEIGDSLDDMAKTMERATDEFKQKMKAKWNEVFGEERR